MLSYEHDAMNWKLQVEDLRGFPSFGHVQGAQGRPGNCGYGKKGGGGGEEGEGGGSETNHHSL